MATQIMCIFELIHIVVHTLVKSVAVYDFVPDHHDVTVVHKGSHRSHSHTNVYVTVLSFSVLLLPNQEGLRAERNTIANDIKRKTYHQVNFTGNTNGERKLIQKNNSQTTTPAFAVIFGTTGTFLRLLRHRSHGVTVIVPCDTVGLNACKTYFRNQQYAISNTQVTIRNMQFAIRNGTTGFPYI